MFKYADSVPIGVDGGGVRTLLYPSLWRDVSGNDSGNFRALGCMKPAQILLTLLRSVSRKELKEFVFLKQLLETYFVFYCIPPVITINGLVDNEECSVVIRPQDNNYIVQVRKVS